MIIPLSGGVGNGGVIETNLPVKVGDGIRIYDSNEVFNLLDEYKVYSNGVARCVDGQYVVASTGRRWAFTAAAVVDR